MLIEIGRDIVTSKLRLSLDGKSLLTEKADVPPTVSRDHCQIEIDGNVMRLINTDINNYTYVNGQAIEAKIIQPTDCIELGNNHYLVDWEYIEKLLPPVADISALKKVWEDYEQANINLQIDERRFNTLRSITGLITMVAIALSIATGGRSLWYLVLYAVAISASLIFFVKSYRDASKIPQKRQELTRGFLHDYICPHCGHFLGNQPYDILVQNDSCSYCKTKFIH